MLNQKILEIINSRFLQDLIPDEQNLVLKLNAIYIEILLDKGYNYQEIYEKMFTDSLERKYVYQVYTEYIKNREFYLTKINQIKQEILVIKDNILFTFDLNNITFRIHVIDIKFQNIVVTELNSLKPIAYTLKFCELSNKLLEKIASLT